MNEKTLHQEWVKERIKAVSERYDVYDALVENGVELGGRELTVQIPCPLPGHGPDERPSARYYAADGSDVAHFYCFKCKVRLDGIGLLAKLRGIEYMRALSELERHFGVKVPRQHDVIIEMPSDKGPVSEAWGDVPRMLAHLELKLARVRDKSPMLEYIKWCRVVDAVRWDLDHNGGKPTPDMVAILMKLKTVIDGAGHANI